MSGTVPERVKCCDCAHINQGSCDRPVGRHFHTGSNSYRTRLHVLAAQERNRERTLTGRVCCGPEGRYFEPKGSLDPIVPVEEPELNDAQIKQMVDRFLTWKLPEDFAPDCGISFERVSCKGTPHEFHFAPVGTNLFTAAQAEAMVRHMLGQTAHAAGAQSPATAPPRQRK